MYMYTILHDTLLHIHMYMDMYTILHDMCVTMDIKLGKNVDPEIQDIPKKHLKLSLAKKNRFVYKQKEEMEIICKGYVPPKH